MNFVRLGSGYYISNLLRYLPSELPFQLPGKGLQDQHRWTTQYTLQSSIDLHPLPISFSVYGCVVSHIALPHLVAGHTAPANQLEIMVSAYMSTSQWQEHWKTLSKRPGRRRAASIAFGRFVAPNTRIPVASSKPSISVNKVDKSLSPTVALPLEFPPEPVLLGAMASASSKNIMLGEARRAFWNVLRNRASPSPTYLEYKSAPLL